MIGYPLDSHVTYEADGTPVYDRGISSAPLRSLIKKLFSDGVMPNPSTNMQVVASTGMNVQVQAGFAITGGCLKLLESAETLTIDAASTLPRIDAIVLRLDDNDNVRTCELAVKKGTAASSPVAPTARRDEVMWEICLAQIAVAANTTAITNANITDTRLDTDLCGYISSISEFDTTTLYQQIQSDLEFFREDEQARLTAWFDTFIDELTTDQAINLQNQINVLDYKIDNLDVLDTTEEIAANTDPGKITGALATKSVIDSLSASTKYDSSEIDTGLKWIDGKTIYRRCFSDSGLSIGNTNYLICSDILNTYNILKLQGTIKVAENFWYPDGVGGMRNTDLSTFRVTTQGLMIRNEATSSPLYIIAYNVVVEYTK